METPRERHERGLAMMAVTNADFADLAYLRSAEEKLSADELEEFRALFFSKDCRGVAGVRQAVDLALAAMRTKLMQRLGTPTWRAR